jgi:hypothetical protein
MKAFQLLLMTIFIAIVGYTLVTISRHGLNLLPIFFGDIAKMGWPGQVNFDFLGFLILSGLWTAWRERFSAKGLILGVFAFFGGIFFLSAYLLCLSFKTDGDMKKIMLGERILT